MVERLEPLEGVKFPKDINTVDHLLRIINSSKNKNAEKNAEMFREESYSKFKKEDLLSEIKSNIFKINFS